MLTLQLKNASLLEKLEFLLLRLEISDPNQHAKVESLRNRLVGEALPYQGRFRKVRVEHEGLLSCFLDSQTTAGTSAPCVTDPATRPLPAYPGLPKKSSAELLGEQVMAQYANA